MDLDRRLETVVRTTPVTLRYGPGRSGSCGVGRCSVTLTAASTEDHQPVASASLDPGGEWRLRVPAGRAYLATLHAREGSWESPELEVDSRPAVLELHGDEFRPALDPRLDD